MKRLAKRFSRKITDDLIEIYFDSAERIPDRPFSDITKHFIERSKAFPTPGDFLDQWYDWQKSHPEQMYKENKRQECDVCDGTGVIEVEQIPQFIRKNPKFKYEKNPWRLGLIYKSVVRCGHCNNKGASSLIPRMTLDQISESKLTRLQEKERPIIERKPVKDMEKLTNKVIKEIPDESHVMARKQELLSQIEEIPDDDIPF